MALLANAMWHYLKRLRLRVPLDIIKQTFPNCIFLTYKQRLSQLRIGRHSRHQLQGAYSLCVTSIIIKLFQSFVLKSIIFFVRSLR